MNYKYANRIERVKPSAIRELLKLGADPSIISFGGGYPDPEIFPIDKLRKVYDQVLQEEGKLALQYTGTEGLMPLREKLVNRVKRVTLIIFLLFKVDSRGWILPRRLLLTEEMSL